MFSLAQLADYVDGVWHGNAEHAISGFAPLARATSKEISCYDQGLLASTLKTTRAGIVLLKENDKHLYHGNVIVVANPQQAMVRTMSLISCPPADFSISPLAQIHPSAQIKDNVSIGDYAVIGPKVYIEEGTRIGAHAILEEAAHLKKDCHIAASVVIHSFCQLGSQVRVDTGSVIGASPFNYSKQQGAWLQGPILGTVLIEDRVHVGANTVIDKGTLRDTHLAEGICIDNFVHIAHDVLVGKNTIVGSGVSLGAGSVLGVDCVIGSGSCIAAYSNLADDVIITELSSIYKSIAKAGCYSSGTLAQEHHHWRRNAARFKRLDKFMTKFISSESD